MQYLSISLAALLSACASLSVAGVTPMAESSAASGAAVVELYTSQGCSSCPPADALLGELSKMPNIIALAFHVDYWDSIGWRDHFAVPIAVERQHRYVEALGLSSAFTPQVVVNGHSSFVGSDKRRILAALAEPRDTIPVTLAIADRELTVSLPERAELEAYDVNLIAYLPEAVTSVGRGENSGKVLQEYNIVRQFRSLGVWRGHESVIRMPLDSIPVDASRVAVILQRVQQGQIAGSATLALH